MDRGTDSLYGVSAELLCALTGAHLTTARRWKRSRRCPRWLRHLIDLCVYGRLEEISRRWAGWTIRGNHLVSPEGWEFTPGEIRSIPFMHGQIRLYQELQRTARQADWIEQRFVELDVSDQVA